MLHDPRNTTAVQRPDDDEHGVVVRNILEFSFELLGTHGWPRERVAPDRAAARVQISLGGEKIQGHALNREIVLPDRVRHVCEVLALEGTRAPRQ